MSTPNNQQSNSENTTQIPQNIIEDSNEKKRKKSAVWKEFTEDPDPAVNKAACNYCNKKLVYTSGSGTSSLLKHLRTCSIKKIRERGQRQIGDCIIQNGRGDVSKEMKIYTFNQEESLEAIIDFFAMCEVPLNVANHHAFIRMMNVIRPELKLIKGQALHNRLISRFQREKELVKNSFSKSSGRICLTTDTWTSNQTIGYMSLTAHFVDENWRLQKKIINFIKLDERHTGNYLTSVLVKCLSEWDIENKLFTITMDDHSTNGRVVDLLHERIEDSLPLNGEFFHVRCSAHILNLIVREGIKRLDKSVSRIRDAVKFIKYSPQRLKIFGDPAKQLKLDVKKKLLLDVVTRWNSTFLMLERALVFKAVFKDFHSVENFAEPPTEIDWHLAMELCKFLKIFDDVTNIFSASKTPTANLYFHNVCMIQMHLRKERNEHIIREMQEGMRQKFDQYWKDYSQVLSIAAVLDPRHKMCFVEFCYKKIYGSEHDAYMPHVNRVHSALQRLFEWYKKLAEKEVVQPVEASHVASVRELSQRQNSEDSADDFMQEYYRDESIHNTDDLPLKSELEEYLEEQVRSNENNFDVLKYWKSNEQKYPIISCIARDLLAVPITTVASESAFSTGNRVIDDKRASLEASIIEALICYSDWQNSNWDNVLANVESIG